MLVLRLPLSPFAPDYGALTAPVHVDGPSFTGIEYDVRATDFSSTEIAMKPMFAAALAAAFLVPAATAKAANSACGVALSAEGKSTRVEGSDDYKHYNGHIPADLAQLRAISAWQGRVADTCPGYSAVWRRAFNARVDCDSGMGHDYCTATATPRRKLFSWFLPQ
jgi:hypothetical protein